MPSCTARGSKRRAGRAVLHGGRQRLTHPGEFGHEAVDGEDAVDPRRGGARRVERLFLVGVVARRGAEAVTDAEGVLVVLLGGAACETPPRVFEEHITLVALRRTPPGKRRLVYGRLAQHAEGQTAG